MKLFFHMYLVILKSCKFIQSFQVGVVRHAQSDSKQQVNYITRLS